MIIDLHSHLIPAIDDGAQTLEDSYHLMRMGEEEGVEHLVLTPHHRNGQFMNRKAEIIQFTDQLARDYQALGLKVTIYPGQEIRLTEHFMEDFYNDDLLSLDAEGRYFLIEFPTAGLPKFTIGLLNQMLDQGITPVIAHPERNHQLMQHLEDLYELIEMGCLSQITSSSYVGLYGEKFQSAAKQMIHLNLAHIIASDVHHVDYRPFNMKAAFEQLQADFGQEQVDYFQQNARDILNGDPVQAQSAQSPKKSQLKKKWFFGLF